MSKHLHIVSFDIPFPADYGGVIDVFYKIKSLHEAKVKIHLHCFEYGRAHAKELEKYCEKVYYYKRKSAITSFFFLPHIVASRRSEKLIEDLNSTDYPILFEGLHTCYLLSHPSLKDRKKIVRAHNIEHEYYHHLYKSETHFFKKAYFLFESLSLKKFENKLQYADALLSISKRENDYFKNKFPDKNILLIPPFIKYKTTDIQAGKGSYILFHGNLSVSENKKAVKYLVENISPQLGLPLIIAGKNPDLSLAKICKAHNIELVSNPTEDKLLDLIKKAHINLLVSFQETGSKLKLFSALYSGRHCVTNMAMTDDPKLKKLCHVAQNTQEILSMIEKLKGVDLNTEDINLRNTVLQEVSSNSRSADQIIKLL